MSGKVSASKEVVRDGRTVTRKLNPKGVIAWLKHREQSKVLTSKQRKVQGVKMIISGSLKLGGVDIEGIKDPGNLLRTAGGFMQIYRGAELIFKTQTHQVVAEQEGAAAAATLYAAYPNHHAALQQGLLDSGNKLRHKVDTGKEGLALQAYNAAWEQGRSFDKSNDYNNGVMREACAKGLRERVTEGLHGSTASTGIMAAGSASGGGGRRVAGDPDSMNALAEALNIFQEEVEAAKQKVLQASSASTENWDDSQGENVRDAIEELAGRVDAHTEAEELAQKVQAKAALYSGLL